jgi:hypothetical protein
MEYGVKRDHVEVFDWDEAQRQNPGDDFSDITLADRIREHGTETQAQAEERAQRMIAEARVPGESAEDTETRVWKDYAAQRAAERAQEIAGA